MQVGHFVADARFKDVMSSENEKIKTFFDKDKNPILPLGYAIPFGQFAEADLGQGEMSIKQVQRVVDELNK
jgi:hypothetical protein